MTVPSTLVSPGQLPVALPLEPRRALCQLFARGRCHYGHHCKYLHAHPRRNPPAPSAFPSPDAQPTPPPLPDHAPPVTSAAATTTATSSSSSSSSSSSTGSAPAYPRRPAAPDCQYYLKTGKCNYASRCKFNHPERHAALVSSLNRRDCFDFVQNGVCPYGKTCKYNHPPDGRAHHPQPSSAASTLNPAPPSPPPSPPCTTTPAHSQSPSPPPVNSARPPRSAAPSSSTITSAGSSLSSGSSTSRRAALPRRSSRARSSAARKQAQPAAAPPPLAAKSHTLPVSRTQLLEQYLPLRTASAVKPWPPLMSRVAPCPVTAGRGYSHEAPPMPTTSLASLMDTNRTWAGACSQQSQHQSQEHHQHYLIDEALDAAIWTGATSASPSCTTATAAAAAAVAAGESRTDYMSALLSEAGSTWASAGRLSTSTVSAGTEDRQQISHIRSASLSLAHTLAQVYELSPEHARRHSRSQSLSGDAFGRLWPGLPSDASNALDGMPLPLSSHLDSHPMSQAMLSRPVLSGVGDHESQQGLHVRTGDPIHDLNVMPGSTESVGNNCMAQSPGEAGGFDPMAYSGSFFEGVNEKRALRNVWKPTEKSSLFGPGLFSMEHSAL